MHPFQNELNVSECDGITNFQEDRNLSVIVYVITIDIHMVTISSIILCTHFNVIGIHRLRTIFQFGGCEREFDSPIWENCMKWPVNFYEISLRFNSKLLLSSYYLNLVTMVNFALPKFIYFYSQFIICSLFLFGVIVHLLYVLLWTNYF